MEIGGVTSDLIRLGLDAALAQHQAISQNIANVNSSEYRKAAVNFDELFSSIENASNSASMKSAVNSAAQRLNSGMVMRYTDKQVKLEEEMAIMAKNTLYYKALLNGLSKRGDAIKMAISEGK